VKETVMSDVQPCTCGAVPAPGACDGSCVPAASGATYRVYLREWICVFSTRAGDDLGQQHAAELCMAHFVQKYEGRVRPSDHQLFRDGRRIQLQLRLPNLKGEFKTLARAQAHVAAQGWDGAEIVARSSSAETKLLSYGQAKLPAGVG
jgi:hypothetical protein